MWIRQTYGLAIDKACDLAKLSHYAGTSQGKNEQQEGLRMWIRGIANDRPRFGCEWVYVMHRWRKKHKSLHCGMPPPASGPNERWSMVPQGFPLVTLSMIS